MAITRARSAPAQLPASLSMFDPVHVAVDETGYPVYLDFADQVGIIVAGEPGAGKSVGLANIVAHAALSYADCRLTLIDGALVELGIWRHCADVFVGPDINHAITVLEKQQQEITGCCQMLLDTGRRKIVKSDGEPVHLTVIDELAYYSATVGTKAEREKFNTALRDCSARGRKCARRYVIATQRPSSDIVPTSLRDLFGYRWAFRCATDDSSDVVLGKGQARAGYTAAVISDQARGVGLLRAEGTRTPRRVKAAYLTDDELRAIAARAAILRGRPRTLDEVA
jgi:DNA segregation ATPase FtsK/SpoIIIE, S-DNA-T family